MKIIALFCTVILLTSQCRENRTGWAEEGLEQVISVAEEIGTYALVIQSDGKIVASFGDIDKVSRVHSVRKAILSALVAQHLDKINLQATLAELDINDKPIPLTALQQSTKVLHLLKSTSGINHPAVSQVGSMAAKRDSLLGINPNIPGTKWAYNNWDYNALTTILEEQTDLTFAEAFAEGLAKPLGMQDFETIYRRDTTLSMHAKAGVRISTRDMANFGQLYLQEGRWNGQQLIPKQWIKKITSDYTLTQGQSNERAGHGYLWWLPGKDYAGGLPANSFLATGAWGQRILVIPEWNTVIAHKTMTEVPKSQRKTVSSKEFELLVSRIVAARIHEPGSKKKTHR